MPPPSIRRRRRSSPRQSAAGPVSRVVHPSVGVATFPSIHRRRRSCLRPSAGATTASLSIRRRSCQSRRPSVCRRCRVPVHPPAPPVVSAAPSVHLSLRQQPSQSCGGRGACGGGRNRVSRGGRPSHPPRGFGEELPSPTVAVGGTGGWGRGRCQRMDGGTRPMPANGPRGRGGGAGGRTGSRRRRWTDGDAAAPAPADGRGCGWRQTDGRRRQLTSDEVAQKICIQWHILKVVRIGWHIVKTVRIGWQILKINGSDQLL